MNEMNLTYRRHPLDAIFAPRNVAVIGATEAEGSVGRTLLWNLISNPFGGAIFPVNPKRDNVMGVHAYKSMGALPLPVDLAVIATPAHTVPALIEECIEAGVRGAIILSAGFREIGEEGAKREAQILQRARAAQMRIIGPNCLGVMSPVTGLNATFARGMARSGNIGLISQSGALLTAVLDWGFAENVGFSHVVSVGSVLDVSWGDLLYYMGDDDRTKAIVLYMESVGNARSFLSAAREVSLSKPIIVLKAGRTEAAAQAAASHTGALVGSDAVLDAAFRRSGVLRVERIAELFSMAETLSKQPLPKGPNLTIVTNAGGPGVLATDALIGGGGALTAPSTETMKRLRERLPDPWSHHNPIDILSDASPARYADTVATATDDANTDGVLVIVTPQSRTDPTETAKRLCDVAKGMKKPLLASWMGGAEIEAGESILNRANISTFRFPDTAARIFNYMWTYSRNLESIYETPELAPIDRDGSQRASEMIEQLRDAGRTILTEYESKQIFEAYGIPIVQTLLAADEDEAVAKAEQIGYPVVLKLNSHTITHKSDVGGVQLNLNVENEVRRAFQRIQRRVHEAQGAGHFDGVTVQPMIKLEGYELIVGSSIDPQFGPTILFGTGGTLVEVFRDRALALPPLNSTLARILMEQTKIYAALQGQHGQYGQHGQHGQHRRKVDLEALAGVLVRFSQLVVEQRWIKEVDINPLLASQGQITALDARILLHEPETSEAELPELAIRPYPQRYRERFELRTGETVDIRPIRPEDEPMMSDFNGSLSPHSIYLRYFHPVSPQQLTSHDQLARMTFIDYDREMTLVAQTQGYSDGDNSSGKGKGSSSDDNKERIVGMGQLSKLHGSSDAEFAILIDDDYQRTGLGTQLLKRLLDVARHEGIERVVAEILPENSGMRRVCEKLGFTMKRTPENDIFAQINVSKT